MRVMTQGVPNGAFHQLEGSINTPLSLHWGCLKAREWRDRIFLVVLRMGRVKDSEIKVDSVIEESF